ncbi:MAG: methyltransferase domain-containing protein [Candidatus Nitrosotenuis sp.]
MDDSNEIRRIAKIYDERASKYNSVDAAGQWGSKEQAVLIAQEILKKSEIAKEHSVLEIGCGSGVLGNVISKNCEFYVGFDASNLMLKKFLEEHGSEKNNLLVATATEIPCVKKTFDRVVMNGVTMYFPNEKFLRKVLAEILTVCKNDAVIFIGENIIPSRFQWEFVWFQNLSPKIQFFARTYISFRKWLAKKSPRLAGKWKHAHKDVSPKIIEGFFGTDVKVEISDSVAYAARKRTGSHKGNKRVDFLIRLKP